MRDAYAKTKAAAALTAAEQTVERQAAEIAELQSQHSAVHAMEEARMWAVRGTETKAAALTAAEQTVERQATEIAELQSQQSTVHAVEEVRLSAVRDAETKRSFDHRSSENLNGGLEASNCPSTGAGKGSCFGNNIAEQKLGQQNKTLSRRRYSTTQLRVRVHMLTANYED